MTEMVRRYLRQKLGSLLVVIGLLCLVPMAAGVILSAPGQTDNFPATLAVLFIAAGCVSRDASGGALQMILARPIRRSEYLIGRFLGITATFGIFLAASLALALAIPHVAPVLGLGPLDTVSALFGVIGTFLDGLLTASIILLLSTFLPSYADAFGYILFLFMLAAPNVLGQLLKNKSLIDLGAALKKNVDPSVPWPELLHGQNVLREATGRYVLALVVFLAAALIVFSRREFAYGQD